MAREKHSIKILKQNPCFFPTKAEKPKRKPLCFFSKTEAVEKQKRHSAHKQAGAKQNRIEKLSKPEFTQSVKQGVPHHCSLQIQNSIYNEKESKGTCQCQQTRRSAPTKRPKKTSLTY
jgi:hypothetical protein